jgi:hypothetical protein
MWCHVKRRETVLKDVKKLDRKVVLTHPSDSSQWKALDTKYPTFGEDPWNIRYGASTDGLNPFGSRPAHIAGVSCLYGYTTPPPCGCG